MIGGTLVVVTEMWPHRENEISGVFVSEQARVMSRHFTETHVLVLQRWGKPMDLLAMSEQFGEQSSNVRLSPVRVPRLPVSSGRLGGWVLAANALLTSGAVRRAVRRLEGEPTILLHGLRYPAFAGRSVSPRVRWVVAHGVDDALRSAVNGNALLRRLLRRGMSSASSRVLVGPSLADFIVEMGLDHLPYDVVPNGFREIEYAESARETLSVLSVSNLTATKGIDTQLRAWARLKEAGKARGWVYTIVGDGPERPRLESLARQLDVTDTVSFLGRVSRDETLRLIAECGVFSLPSTLEAFGIVYLEAMSCGKPVIACEDVGPVGVVVDGVNGRLVPPDSAAGVAAALADLTESDDLRRELGLRGRETAKKFSWDENVRRYLGLTPDF